MPEAHANYVPRWCESLTTESIEVWTDAQGVLRARDVHWTRRRILRAIAGFLVCGALIWSLAIAFAPPDRLLAVLVVAIVAWICLGIILLGGYHALAPGADYLRFDPREGEVHLPTHKRRIPIDQVLRVVLIRFHERHSENAATYDLVLETTHDGSERWLHIARLNARYPTHIMELSAGLGVPKDSLELGEITLVE